MQSELICKNLIRSQALWSEEHSTDDSYRGNLSIIKHISWTYWFILMLLPHSTRSHFRAIICSEQTLLAVPTWLDGRLMYQRVGVSWRFEFWALSLGRRFELVDGGGVESSRMWTTSSSARDLWRAPWCECLRRKRETDVFIDPCFWCLVILALKLAPIIGSIRTEICVLK